MMDYKTKTGMTSMKKIMLTMPSITVVKKWLYIGYFPGNHYGKTI